MQSRRWRAPENTEQIAVKEGEKATEGILTTAEVPKSVSSREMKKDLYEAQMLIEELNWRHREHKLSRDSFGLWKIRSFYLL